MALPLPKVVSDVGPGGPLVTAMGGINALNQGLIKSKYMPITSQADAASKLAYARLMYPQFMAKLMGNPDAVAQMTDPQAQNNLQMLQNAGNGQQSANNIFSGIGQPSTNANSGWLMNAVKNIIGRAPLQDQSGGENALRNPASGYDNSGNPGVSAEGPGPINSGNPFVGRAGYKPPVVTNALNPSIEMDMRGGQVPTPGTQWAENAGRSKGIIAEGQESGKTRTKDMEQLNNTVFNAETNANTLNEINDILGSPEFEEIRSVPLAGHHELAYYAKEGTPAQQDMVGRYYTLTGNLIKDASRDFAGQFRKGEQSLLQGMKPGPADTVDTAKGKSSALTVLNKMLQERSRLTSKYMAQNHANKLEASEWADRQIDGEKIRQDVHDRLHPTITIRHPKTGQTMTLSISEARKRGVPNV